MSFRCKLHIVIFFGFSLVSWPLANLAIGSHPPTSDCAAEPPTTGAWPQWRGPNRDNKIGRDELAWVMACRRSAIGLEPARNRGRDRVRGGSGRENLYSGLHRRKRVRHCVG